MKKISGFLILMMSLSACVFKPVLDNKIHIVVSFYILEDFAKKIGGDYVSITNLTQSVGEPHEFEPSTKDMMTLSDTSYIMILGHDFEPWFNDVSTAINMTKKHILIVSDGIKTRNDPTTGQIDPHVWTSIANAKVMLQNIHDYLLLIDPAHAQAYDRNTLLAFAQFDALANEYAVVMQQRHRDEFITNHAAFSYLAADYGLKLIPIMGLEPDAEPTAARMATIIDTINQIKIPYLLIENEANITVAQAIAHETGIQIGILRTIENLSLKQMKANEDYLSLMRENLTWLKKALN